MSSTSTRLRSSQSYVWLDPTDRLGKGATSFVYKCRNKTSGELCAVKTFIPQNARSQMRELDIMKSLDHQNVMRMIAVEAEEDKDKASVIIMEYCAGGSLQDILEQPEHMCGLADDEMILFITDTVAAIKYLREKMVVHRDVKPGNILKYVDASGQTFFKLTDFGAARGKVEDDGEYQTLTGTEEYLHPAMHERVVHRNPHREGRFGPSCDLWSLGVTIYHVATGKVPFRPYRGRGDPTVMQKITSEKKPGIISGVQLVDGGPIIYSDKLPNTCRLTNACRQLIMPMLAGLMENSEKDMWTYDRLYEFVDKLRTSRFVDIYIMPACTFDRVYFPARVFASAARPPPSSTLPPPPPPEEAGEPISRHAQPLAMQPVAANAPPPKCIRTIKQYIASLYAVETTECDLLIPTMTEQFNRGSTTLIGASDLSGDAVAIESIKFATDAELERVAASLEHTRVRVALNERAASKTWSASAVLSATFADADVDTDMATAGFGLGASMKQYVVAVRRINAQLVTTSTTYVDDMIAKLEMPNTMMYDLKAITKQVVEPFTRDDSLSDTRAQTAYAYSTFLASAALNDAQMLHCATVNFFIVNVESVVHALRERANALNETSRQILQNVQLFKVFVNSQKELLKVCELEYAPAGDAEPDALIDSAPESLHDALQTLTRVLAELDKLEQDCKTRQNEVNEFVRRYYDIIVTKDELRKRWHLKVADKLCFGECLTTALAANAGAKEANLTVTQRQALPCWKRLQANYDKCSALHNSVLSKQTDGGSRSGQQVKKVMDSDRRLIRTRAEESQSQVTQHCWLRTQQCYGSFIHWWSLLEGVAKRINSLRSLVTRHAKDQKDTLQKLTRICTESTTAYAQFRADEKRLSFARKNVRQPTAVANKEVQTSPADTMDSTVLGHFEAALFESVSTRIDTLARELESVRTLFDDTDEELDLAVDQGDQLGAQS